MKQSLIRSERIPKCYLWAGTKFDGCRLLIQTISKEEEYTMCSSGSGSELLFFSYRESENLLYLMINNQRSLRIY